MKALGCAAVCLQLWHGVPDENCVLDNLLSIYEDDVRGCIYFQAQAASRDAPKMRFWQSAVNARLDGVLEVRIGSMGAIFP
jgi:hypothetical protein